MKRARAVAVYVLVAGSIVAGGVAAGLHGDWRAVYAWTVALIWAGVALVVKRAADRWARAYLIALGRNMGEYSRGLTDGYHLRGLAAEDDDRED